MRDPALFVIIIIAIIVVAIFLVRQYRKVQAERLSERVRTRYSVTDRPPDPGGGGFSGSDS